jgi:Glycosyl transferase family 2
MSEAAPSEIRELAHARAAARQARDWPEADRLRAEIESVGWKVVDQGTHFELVPAHPADAVDGELVRYGRSEAVPSNLETPATSLATIVLLATDWPDDLARALTGLREHAPDGTQVVVVADAPSLEQEAALRDPVGPVASLIGGLAPEVVWTSERLGHAAATNAGLRRALAPVTILLDTSLEPIGDVVTPLVRALDDPSVAVTGGWGLVSADLRSFEDGPAGDVDAIEGYCQAFRRDDVAARGPLDERFRFYRNLDIWWSLVLRDEGDGNPPHRAARLADLPFERHEHRGYGSLPPAERDRLTRRNFYRVMDRFGSRLDLLVANAARQS